MVTAKCKCGKSEKKFMKLRPGDLGDGWECPECEKNLAEMAKEKETADEDQAESEIDSTPDQRMPDSETSLQSGQEQDSEERAKPEEASETKAEKASEDKSRKKPGPKSGSKKSGRKPKESKAE